MSSGAPLTGNLNKDVKAIANEIWTAVNSANTNGRISAPALKALKSRINSKGPNRYPLPKSSVQRFANWAKGTVSPAPRPASGNGNQAPPPVGFGPSLRNNMIKRGSRSIQLSRLKWQKPTSLANRARGARNAVKKRAGNLASGLGKGAGAARNALKKGAGAVGRLFTRGRVIPGQYNKLNETA